MHRDGECILFLPNKVRKKGAIVIPFRKLKLRF